jgi:hypothetical protein
VKQLERRKVGLHERRVLCEIREEFPLSNERRRILSLSASDRHEPVPMFIHYINRLTLLINPSRMTGTSHLGMRLDESAQSRARVSRTSGFW